jgi:preprotein translocase subunit YajC
MIRLGGILMYFFIGFIVIFIFLVLIEVQLNKNSKQNEEIIKLLNQIKDTKS